MSEASSDELALHQRIIAGDETASADVFDRYLKLLIEELSRYNPQVTKRDAALISDAVTEALFNYVEKPSSYDPKRKGLLDYLLMSAEGDLRNLLDKERRQEKKKESLDQRVELDRDPRNSLMNIFSRPDTEMEAKEVRQKIRGLFSDERDCEVAEMILMGIRETKHYARVLEFDELPVEKQRKEVNRVKDRIKKALDRANWTDFLDPN